MKTTSIINNLLKLEDEFQKVEEENKHLKRILSKEGKQELSEVEKIIIDLGKEKLFEECSSYDCKYQKLEYTENGINKPFEKWIVNAINISSVPSNLSSNTVKEVLYEKLKKQYEKHFTNAKMEYARLQIGNKQGE